MEKKLFIRFFEHKDGIPTDSHPVNLNGFITTPKSEALDLSTEIIVWMNAHVDGKVDFCLFMMDSARHKWFNQILANFNCSLNGHSNIVELHRYPAQKIIRSFAGRSLENLRAKKPYLEARFMRKCACRSCGRIFLENCENITH